MYAKISYFSYRFTPPIIDDNFRHWLSQKSKNEVEKFLREKAKTEWFDFLNPVTLVFILIFVISCTIFPIVESKYPNSNSILGTLLAGAAIGLFLSFLGIVVTALSIAKMQIARILWYKKCKNNFDREEPKAKSPKSNFPGTDHEVWNGVDSVMQDAFRDYAKSKPLDQIAKERNMTEKAALNIVRRMKARFAKMGVYDPTPPVAGQSATGGTSKPQGIMERTRQSVYQCVSSIVELAKSAARFLTQWGKLQKTLIILVIAVFVLFGLMAIGKIYSEPKISGHPVAYWVEKLEDLDIKTRIDAYRKLSVLDPQFIEPAHGKLRKLANLNKTNNDRYQFASNLLHEKFDDQ